MAKPLHVNVIENLWQHVLKKDPQWFERQAGATPLHPDPHRPQISKPRPPACPACAACAAYPPFPSAVGRLDRSLGPRLPRRRT